MMICRNLATNNLTPSEPSKCVRRFGVLSLRTVGMDYAVSEEAITFIVIISSSLRCDDTRINQISSFGEMGESI